MKEADSCAPVKPIVIDGKKLDANVDKHKENSFQFLIDSIRNDKEFSDTALMMGYLVHAANEKVTDMMYWKLGVNLVSMMAKRLADKSQEDSSEG